MWFFNIKPMRGAAFIAMVLVLGPTTASSYPESEDELFSHFFQLAHSEAPAEGISLYTTGINPPSEDPSVFYGHLTRCNYDKCVVGLYGLNLTELLREACSSTYLGNPRKNVTVYVYLRDENVKEAENILKSCVLYKIIQ